MARVRFYRTLSRSWLRSFVANNGRQDDRVFCSAAHYDGFRIRKSSDRRPWCVRRETSEQGIVGPESQEKPTGTPQCEVTGKLLRQ